MDGKYLVRNGLEQIETNDRGRGRTGLGGLGERECKDSRHFGSMKKSEVYVSCCQKGNWDLYWECKVF